MTQRTSSSLGLGTDIFEETACVSASSCMNAVTYGNFETKKVAVQRPMGAFEEQNKELWQAHVWCVRLYL